LYTDKQKHDVGTVTTSEQIGPDYDTPTLNGLYDSAPYFHDGSVHRLYDALTYPSSGSEHDVSGLLTESEIQDLITFLLALPYED
jgi:cytochrome c peroxidase